MAKRKIQKKMNFEYNNVLKKNEKTSPFIQKIVLLLFGLGPILIMGWFLYLKGFFQ